MDKFQNRRHAGILLASHLMRYAKDKDALIFALPRGGVPVAFEIAQRLALPLLPLIVRKLGAPGNEELAIGAIASGGTVVLNDVLISQLGVTSSWIDSVLTQQQLELSRRERLYSSPHPVPNLTNKTIILVDDGIATGFTMRAAIESIKHHHPKAVIAAIPVAALSTCNELNPLVDDLICLLKPVDLYAVGFWYEEFPQISDGEVTDLLARSSC